MNIRQATVADAKVIAELNTHVQGVHRDALPNIFKPPLADAEMIALNVERLDNEDAVTFIAEDNGQPIGYIYAHVHHRPENPFSYERHYILVDAMSVNPDYYGTGVADMLMQSVKVLAVQHQVQRIILDVWDFNGRAKRFYEKQGFTTYNYKMQWVLE
jgi:GNAT superfamily N-acetyltransferase